MTRGARAGAGVQRGGEAKPIRWVRVTVGPGSEVRHLGTGEPRESLSLCLHNPHGAWRLPLPSSPTRAYRGSEEHP